MIRTGRKKRLYLLALSVLLAAGACAKSKNEDSSYYTSSNPASSSKSNELSDYEYDDSYSGYDNADLMSEAKENESASSDTALKEERKIIQNASLDIEAPDAAGLYNQIAAYGNELGGYEYSYNISHYEDYSIIRAVIKVPPKSLNSFIHFVGDNGKIINSSMSSEDITDNYYDTKTRLETKRKSLERYYELLGDADTIEEIVFLQSTIDSITLEIESFEGRLKLWNSLVNMATIDIYIRQYNDPVKIRKDIDWNTLTFDDMGYLIKQGFVTISNAIISVLQWILIAAAAGSPLLVIALCVFLIARRRKKNQRKKPGYKDINGSKNLSDYKKPKASNDSPDHIESIETKDSSDF